MNKFITSGSVLLSAILSSHAFAASDTGSASVNVVTPISVTNTADLNFGDISVGASGGTVTISETGTRGATGDVSLLSTNGGGAGSFDVSGLASATYSITLPSSATVTSGTNTMSVGTFSTDATGVLDTSGAEVLNIGAILTVNGDQAQGAYTGSYDVVVEYN